MRRRRIGVRYRKPILLLCRNGVHHIVAGRVFSDAVLKEEESMAVGPGFTREDCEFSRPPAIASNGLFASGALRLPKQHVRVGEAGRGSCVFTNILSKGTSKLVVVRRVFTVPFVDNFPEVSKSCVHTSGDDILSKSLVRALSVVEYFQRVCHNVRR